MRIVQRVSEMLPFNLIATLSDRYYGYPHFTDEEMEALKG